MKQWQAIAAFVVMFGTSSQAMDPETAIQAARWQKRVLVSFSTNAALEQQCIRYQTELTARDLVVIKVNAKENPELAKKFGITGSGFHLVLIGKDGEEKARQTEPDLSALFRLIDQMPMRRKEMRE